MSLENPLSILFNSEGVELAVSASQALTGSGVQPGVLMFGSSSTGLATPWRAASDGAMFVTGTVNASFSPASNTPVSQGLPGGISDAWNIKITDGTQVLGTGSSAPVWVSGTVSIGNFPTVQAVSVSNFPAVQEVTGTVTAQINQVVSVSNGGPIGTVSSPIFVTGSFTANFDPSTSATVAAIASTVTGSGVTLQAANANRRGLTVYNDSTKILFVKLGTAVTTTDFSVKVSSQGYFEVPANYTGIVTGVWSGVNGFAYVTEILD